MLLLLIKHIYALCKLSGRRKRKAVILQSPHGVEEIFVSVQSNIFPAEIHSSHPSLRNSVIVFSLNQFILHQLGVLAAYINHTWWLLPGFKTVLSSGVEWGEWLENLTCGRIQTSDQCRRSLALVILNHFINLSLSRIMYAFFWLKGWCLCHFEWRRENPDNHIEHFSFIFCRQWTRENINKLKKWR